MSWYDVRCEACGLAQVDFEQPMSVGFPTKCPKCKKKKLVRDYSTPPSLVIQDLTPKTVGQQAERNAKKNGSELQDIKCKEVLGEAEYNKRKAPPPFWRKTRKPLDLTKVRDTAHYIKTGEKG